MTRFTRVVPFVVLAVLAYSSPSSAQEKPAAEAEPPACDEPCFTPFTEPPALHNVDAIRERLEADYPSELRSAGVGGTTIVWILIDDEGEVTRVETARSSGVAELDELALDVAREMEFTPATNRGRAVRAWIQLPIEFEPSAG